MKCNGQISGAEENLARGLVAEYLSGARVEFVLDPLDIGARSGPSRSAVPIDREQSFRLIPIIRSGITISLWTGANGTVG